MKLKNKNNKKNEAACTALGSTDHGSLSLSGDAKTEPELFSLYSIYSELSLWGWSANYGPLNFPSLVLQPPISMGPS